jgi:urease gamma subunit
MYRSGLHSIMALNRNAVNLIDVKVTVKGEPDTQPLIKDFHFDGEMDLKVLSNSVKIITDKLSKGARINVNEVLLTYLDYLIFGFESNADVNYMIVRVSTLLSNKQVMIGVSESLREIRFDIIGDNIPTNQIVLTNPIPAPRYDLCNC